MRLLLWESINSVFTCPPAVRVCQARARVMLGSEQLRPGAQTSAEARMCPGPL